MTDDEQRQIDAIAAGQRDAFETVYRAHKDPLLTAAAILLRGDRAVAEDVLHDVFIQLVEQAASLRLKSSLRNYLMTCCLNRARDYLRRQAAHRKYLEDSVPPVAEEKNAVDGLAAQEQQIRVIQLLSMLPDEQREAVTLRIHGELTFAEIADVIGVSVNTAKSRYRYALEKLQQWWPTDEIEQESKDVERT
ncbi:MAG: sigma-70 family RNA polymerase sigma factor [Planctomycetaceae bacterium]